MTSVMVDIETEGPDPGRHSMLQLAAVKFDENWKITDELNLFLERHPLLPEAGLRRTWHADTVAWWMESSRVAMYDYLKTQCRRHGAAADSAMRLFWEWLPQEAPIWAWPTCFDIPFLQSYARDYFPLLSQRLWQCLDVRSWMAGCIAASGAPLALDDRTRPPFEGQEHDALYDCKWQVWLMGKFERDLNLWRNRDS